MPSFSYLSEESLLRGKQFTFKKCNKVTVNSNQTCGNHSQEVKLDHIFYIYNLHLTILIYFFHLQFTFKKCNKVILIPVFKLRFCLKYFLYFGHGKCFQFKESLFRGKQFTLKKCNKVTVNSNQTFGNHSWEVKLDHIFYINLQFTI